MKPLRDLSKRRYFVSMLFMSVFPLITGAGASAVVPWSNFWWTVTLILLVAWIGWIVLCTIFNWQNKPIKRLLPFILLWDISCFLASVMLWRSTKESIVLGSILIFSHLCILTFAIVYTKEWMLRDFSKVGWLGRLFIGFVVLLPVSWIITIVKLDLFTPQSIKPILAGILGYYLVVPFTVGSIRFRDPNWNPKKKVSL